MESNGNRNRAGWSRYPMGKTSKEIWPPIENFVWGLGFRVQGLVFGVWCLRSRVWV